MVGETFSYRGICQGNAMKNYLNERMTDFQLTLSDDICLKSFAAGNA